METVERIFELLCLLRELFARVLQIVMESFDSHVEKVEVGIWKLEGIAVELGGELGELMQNGG